MGNWSHAEPGTDLLPAQRGQRETKEQVLVVSIEKGYFLSLKVQVNPNHPGHLVEDESCVVRRCQSPVLAIAVEEGQDTILRSRVDPPLPLHGLPGHPHCPDPPFLCPHIHLPEASPRDKSLLAQDTVVGVVSLRIIRHGLPHVSSLHLLPIRGEDELGVCRVRIQSDVHCRERVR